MSMASLTTRLQALEARPAKVDAENDRRFHAAFKAMFDTVNHQGEWGPSKVAPFHHVEYPSDLERLHDRIQSGTTTEADTATMDAWPKCHLDPAELVELSVRMCKMV